MSDWLKRLLRIKPRPQFRSLRFPDGTIMYWYGDEMHPAHVQQLMAMHRKPSGNPFEALLGASARLGE